jgi:hypothetical protein
VMLLALGTLGWTPALGLLVRAGFSPGILYPAAFVGGTLALGALLPSALRALVRGAGPAASGAESLPAG